MLIISKYIGYNNYNKQTFLLMEIKKFLIERFGPNYQGALLLMITFFLIALFAIVLDLTNLIRLTNGKS